MRKKLIVLCTLLCALTPAAAAVRIDINLSAYPNLVPVPGYPVYYAPSLRSNYFYYDGMYWVYQDDDWYVSSWYNGPWEFVEPEDVPSFVLRIPVRYYRRTPAYFRGWQLDAAPRWSEHWGSAWAQHRRGWDQWNRNAAPGRSPLPIYQRDYSGSRYPQQEIQRALQKQHQTYQPHDPAVRRYDRVQRDQELPLPKGRESAPQERAAGPRGHQPGAGQQYEQPPRTQESVPRDNGGSESNARPGWSQQNQHGNDRELQKGGERSGGNK